MWNKPNLDIVNVNPYKKFGQHPSICIRNNPNLDLANINAYETFSQNPLICYQDI